MDEPDIRETLDALIRQSGEDYSSLSRMLGRNAAYIQQFIRRGVPRKLDEADRRTLARYFGVAETVLGGPDPALAPPDVAPLGDPVAIPPGRVVDATAGVVMIPRLDVGASAGPGALNLDERAVGRIGFQPSWLRELAPSAPGNLSMIRVDGVSMAPTLNPGDDILVDLGDGADRLRDGIYVLRIDDALNVKRLAMYPQGRRFTIKSDNAEYPDWTDCSPDIVTIVGRVLWGGRRM